MVGENALDSAEANLLIDAKFTANSTDVLSEGSTNLYFTNERVDDRVAALVVGGNNITATYNDTAGTLTLDGQPGYTDGDVGTYLSTNGYATSSSIIGTITDNAPGTLDTLNELAAALGDDANFSTTVTNNIATKLPLAGGTLTGNLTLTSTASGSSASPELELRRDITGADANYLGQIKFTADNDADQNVVFAKITGKILDASDGTEDGIIEFAHKKAGSNNISARFRSDSLQLINGTNLTVAGTTELTGNVGIGTSSSVTNSTLNVNGGINSTTGIIGYATNDSFTLNGRTQPQYGCNFTGSSGNPSGISGYYGISFATDGAEKMRIDSSGILLVGATSSNSANVGHGFNSNGFTYHTRDGGEVLRVNRKSSDGAIISLHKDGSVVGSIGNNTDFYIASQDGCGLRFTNNQVLPCSESGATQTTSRDLGSHGARFRDLYLSDAIRNGSGDITLDASGVINLDADGADIKFKDGGTEFGRVYKQSTANMAFYTPQNDADMLFQGVDGGSTITALTLDMSEAGAATFNGAVNIPGFITHVGDSNSFFGFPSGDEYRLELAGVERMTMNGTGTTFNEDGADRDFRVETDGNSHMLFVDGGTNGVGINGTPLINFAASSYGHLVFGNAYATDGAGDIKNSGISWPSAANGNQVISSLINASQDGNYGAIMQFHTRNTGGGNLVERMRISQDELVINDASANLDFRVESNNNTHALFVDANGGSGGDILFGVSSRGGMYNGTGANGVAIESLGDQGTTLVVQSSTNSCMYLSNPSGNSNDNFIIFSDAGSTVGQISGTSSGTTYSTTSDRRLKDNIEPISDATDKLMDMKPVTHTWIDNPDEPQVHGFIAQEMQEVIPEAVSGDAESDEMMSMDYGRITPVIVAALQDALKEIKELKTRIDELENN